MQHKLLSTTVLVVAAGNIVPALAEFTISAGVQSTQLFIESQNKLSTNIATVLLMDPQAIVDLNNSTDNQSTNVGGELALGYQHNIDNTFNVALEIFGQLSATHVETPNTPEGADVITTSGGVPVYDATASFDWLAGIRLRPGIYITPATRLFIDGGVVWGGFELEQNNGVVDFWNDLLATDLDNSQNEIVLGWRYGAGVEYKFDDNFVMGLDYTITEFDEITSEFVQDVSYAFNQNLHSQNPSLYYSSSAEYIPTLHTLGLNFKYLFGGGAKKETPKPYYYSGMRDK